jgi:uncharacterized protein
MTRVEEYFERQELEVRRKRAWERTETMKTDERTRLKTLHFMKCPKCGMDLQTIELQGTSVDQCLVCRGTWLDQREIERLLERDLFEPVLSILR